MRNLTRRQCFAALGMALPLRAAAPLGKLKITRFEIQLAAVRKAVGSSLDICLEAAESLSIRSAIQFAGAVAPYRPLFLEEPTWARKSGGPW